MIMVLAAVRRGWGRAAAPNTGAAGTTRTEWARGARGARREGGERQPQWSPVVVFDCLHPYVLVRLSDRQ